MIVKVASFSLMHPKFNFQLFGSSTKLLTHFIPKTRF